MSVVNGSPADTTTASAGTSELSAAPEDVGSCRACPHPWAEHGALDRRFCTATVERSHSRGCICGPGVRRT